MQQAYLCYSLFALITSMKPVFITQILVLNLTPRKSSNEMAVLLR